MSIQPAEMTFQPAPNVYLELNCLTGDQFTNPAVTSHDNTVHTPVDMALSPVQEMTNTSQPPPYSEEMISEDGDRHATPPPPIFTG